MAIASRVGGSPCRRVSQGGHGLRSVDGDLIHHPSCGSFGADPLRSRTDLSPGWKWQLQAGKQG
ncbi:hypothetical protein ColKHC_01422 [Colletotrichum higginsianum]|nr:hypothetical protein ColKHC_01422 [Colletotrichum higginsianum]